MMKNKERRRIEKEKFGTFPEKNNKKRADGLLPSSPLPLPIGRSFFKIMIGNYMEVMHIPPRFARTVGFLRNRHVYIEDSSGDTWRVEVAVVGGSLVFREGWKSFVLDHSITVGELVTFKYMGGRLFHALHFGTHACDRAYSPKKSNTESGRKRPGSDTGTHERPHSRKMRKISEPVTGGSYIPSNGAISKKLSGTGAAAAKNASDNGIRTRPVTTNMPSKEKSYFANAPKTSEVLKGEHVAPAEFPGSGITECPHLLESPRKAPPEPEEEQFNMASKEYTEQKDRLKKKKADAPVTVRSSRTSEVAEAVGTKKQTMENPSIPEEVVCKYLLTEDGTCHVVEEIPVIKISPIKSPSTGKNTLKKCVEMDNGNNRPSDAGISRYSSKEVIELYAHNVEKKSTKKSVVPVKNESMVVCDVPATIPINFKFSVTLPAQSTWLALPEFSCHAGRMKLERMVIILQDPSMNMWPVLYHANHHFVGFLGGWEDFVMANNLHQGDVCKFEALGRTECTFRVHVSR